jgi:predicted PurR-regulated permease PerM
MIRSNSSRTLSQLLAVVVTVVLITVLYLAKTVILPLALAMLLTFVLAPVVTWLERVRLPRIVAIAAVMLAAGVVLGSAGWTVFKQLVQVTDAIPSYTANIQDKIQSFQQPKTTSFSRAQRELDDLSKQISDWSSGFNRAEGHAGAVDLGSPTQLSPYERSAAVKAG